MTDLKPYKYRQGLLMEALAERDARIEKLERIRDAALNMIDDWDNDRLDIGSVGSLEQALAEVGE